MTIKELRLKQKLEIFNMMIKDTKIPPEAFVYIGWGVLLTIYICVPWLMYSVGMGYGALALIQYVVAPWLLYRFINSGIIFYQFTQYMKKPK